MSHCLEPACRVGGSRPRSFWSLWDEACRRAMDVQRRLAASEPERMARFRQAMRAAEESARRTRTAVLAMEAARMARGRPR